MHFETKKSLTLKWPFAPSIIALWCVGYFFSGYINSCESPERALFSACDPLSCSHRSHNDPYKSSVIICNFPRVRGSFSLFSGSGTSDFSLMTALHCTRRSLKPWSWNEYLFFYGKYRMPFLGNNSGVMPPSLLRFSSSNTSLCYSPLNRSKPPVVRLDTVHRTAFCRCLGVTLETFLHLSNLRTRHLIFRPKNMFLLHPERSHRTASSTELVVRLLDRIHEQLVY